MISDKNGQPLSKGDIVSVECVVTDVHEDTDYGLVNLDTVESINPAEYKTALVLAAKQVVKHAHKATAILLAMLAFVAAAQAQPPQDMLVGRVDALEARVAALEQPGDHGPHSAPDPARLTYDAAYRKAVAEGKPLVCWVGGGDALCPACVRTLENEVVSYIAPTFPGCAVPTLVVAMPEGGQLTRVADITQWVTGDAVHGHVPSIRRAIAGWRSHRAIIRGGWSVAPPAPVQLPAFRPMLFAPVRMMRGACASCG